MKAIHKYQNAAKRGDREAIRRIAQSNGYKWTIYDDPKLIALLHRAGIEIDGVQYDKGTTEFTGEVNRGEAVEVDTIKL